MIKVGYDAGHGGFGVTPGKRTPDGEYEWDFNNVVARAFANELALYKGGVSKRFDDPTGRSDVPLEERTNNAIAWNADYYFSFHHNANTGNWGNWTGVETHIYQSPNSKSIALANAIHQALVEAYGLRDRGIKRTNLHITREMQKNDVGVVLLEGGFMDSTIDIVKLRDKSVLGNAGKMIAQAFADHVGLQKITFVQQEEEELNFSSPTLKEWTEYTMISPARRDIIVNAVVNSGVVDNSWLEKHKNGEMTEADYLGLAAMYTVYTNKQ
nr:N-acetylmuramoyl-L-alanine amidase [Lysinibacillus timonensis]